MKGVFWTVCAVSGFASVSQAFLQPSSIIVSSATRETAAAIWLAVPPATKGLREFETC
ncbi:unnamed protein product, partial [Ectocarpus sp. 4 AP-2014]